MTRAKKAPAVPRAFRLWAKATWGWQKGTIALLERTNPAMLAEKIAYWRGETTPKECPEGCIRVGRGRNERRVIECPSCEGTGEDNDAPSTSGANTHPTCEECKGTGDVPCPACGEDDES